jgi:hypothetical protein
VVASTQSYACEAHVRHGREAYARRKVIAEPPFGQIKWAQGFRGFLLRGLDAVRDEWSIVCTSHNLLKLFRAHRLATTPA